MSKEYQTMNLSEYIFKSSLTCLHSAYEVRILDEFLAVVLDKIFHFIPPNWLIICFVDPEPKLRNIKMFLFLDFSYLMLPMIYGWVDGYGPNINLNQNIFLQVFKLLNTKYCLEMSKLLKYIKIKVKLWKNSTESNDYMYL